MNDVLVQPFASINLWHDFDQDYKVSFNRVPVVTELEQTSLELNVGFSAQMSETVSVYGGLQFATGLDDDDNRGYGGNIGLRIKW